MNDPNRKLVQLQSHLCELRAEVAAKQKTITEQRERISELLDENECLRARITLHSTEVAQKDAETQQLREKVRKLETQVEEDGQHLRASITDFETFKRTAQLESHTKDSTIRKLQAEIDGLILANDDLQEMQKKKVTELDGILTACNRKLHETIQSEREKVRTVLEHCRVIIARLNTKVKESDERNSLLEHEMRAKLETIQGFREAIAEQKRAYGEWVDRLKQRTIPKAHEESAEMHEAAQIEHNVINARTNEGKSSPSDPKILPGDSGAPRETQE